MKIYNESVAKLIRPCDMDDGDIAIIRKWSLTDSIGKIVQRFGENLVVLGKNSGNSFEGLSKSAECLVEVLPKGTLLEI